VIIAPTVSIGRCLNYQDEEGEREISIVISPLRVMEVFTGTNERGHRTVWGCNRYQWCQNGRCEFSQKARDERREAREAREAIL
jgi:hypothetical protein